MLLMSMALALATFDDQAAPAPSGATAAQSVNGGRDWIYVSDWPASALAERRGGTVVVRLRVNRTGEVDECAVAVSSGHADLDATTCRAMVMRGRYTPARDARGNRIASEVLRRVLWDPAAVPANS